MRRGPGRRRGAHGAEGRGPIYRMQCYVRARMQRRLFLALAATVIVTGALVAVVLRLLGAAPHRQGGHPFLTLAIGLAVLWAASGALARRMARPLGELARVAEDLGRGDVARRRALGDRHHHHGEMGVLAAALDEMAARIESQLTDQRALLAAVSHEIRTPLARIRLLVEKARSKDAEHALDEIDREVVSIDALVADLLAGARIDFTAITRKRLDAAALAREAAARSGLDPERLALPGDPVLVDVDATLLGRALVNLVDNAARHGGGAVRLRVEERDDRVAFEVEDEGPGILPGDEQRIFEPFYRPAASAAKTGSVGLGLALVKRIAEAHGGRAYARSRDPRGALVGIEIPRATSGAAEPESLA